MVHSMRTPFWNLAHTHGVCTLTAICKFQHEKNPPLHVGDGVKIETEGRCSMCPCRKTQSQIWDFGRYKINWLELNICWPSSGQDSSLPAPQRSSSTTRRSCTTRPSTPTPGTAWTSSAACPSRCLEAWPSPASCCSSTGTEQEELHCYHVMLVSQRQAVSSPSAF